MQTYNTATMETDFNFQYPDLNDPILSELKTLGNIDLKPDVTELEKAKIVIGYAHGLFTHNGDNTPSSSDPLTIIKEAQAGQSFRCVEYSTLAAALLWAYAIPARTVGLKTSDVQTREYGAGHVVIEFWNSDYQKWIMCDVQAGIIPQTGGMLLSAFELGQKLGSAPVDYVPVSGSRFSPERTYGDKENYAAWIEKYLYFFDTPVHLQFIDMDRPTEKIAMLIPLNVPAPKLFQNLFVMNAVYTRSVLDFYPAL